MLPKTAISTRGPISLRFVNPSVAQTRIIDNQRNRDFHAKSIILYSKSKDVLRPRNNIATSINHAFFVICPT